MHIREEKKPEEERPNDGNIFVSFCMYKLLLAPVSPAATCTISFCASMLRFQTRLSKEPSVSASIMFFDAVAEAEKAFQAGDYDGCIIIDTRMGVETDFLFAPPQHACEIAPYPLPKVDWDRVTRKVGSDSESTETLSSVGNVYNFDPSQGTGGQGARFTRVPRSAVTEMSVLKLRRGATLADVEEVYVDLAHPAVNHGPLGFAGCVGTRTSLRG